MIHLVTWDGHYLFERWGIKYLEMKKVENKNTRRINLKGAYNFRDLGGYLTPEGKQTIWRKLFRSDNLAKLTKADLKKLEKLNIQLIIDLRSKEERSSKPNRLPMGNGIKIENIEIADSNQSHNELKRKIFYGKLKGLDLEEEIIKSYRLAITDYQNELSKFFELLLDPENYPVLVLCNSGKDRTGVVIALTLMAIGVSQKTVMEDYMLSKVFLNPMIKRITTAVRCLSFFRADITQLQILLDTRAEYLNATLHAIEQKFGSTETFFDSLGIGHDKREKMKQILIF